MLRKKELSFVLPNRPGTIAEVLTALAKAKVNLLAIDASGGFEYNIVRLVPENHKKAKSVLKKQGFDVGEATILCISTDDAPGALAKIAVKLGRAKINIDYLYATGGKLGSPALIVLHTSDPKQAGSLLD